MKILRMILLLLMFLVLVEAIPADIIVQVNQEVKNDDGCGCPGCCDLPIDQPDDVTKSEYPPPFLPHCSRIDNSTYCTFALKIPLDIFDDPCNSTGGHLARFHKFHTMNMVLNALGPDLWVGVMALFEDVWPRFVWSDGKPINSEFWISGAPTGPGDCGILVYNINLGPPIVFDLGLNNTDCSLKKGFICQY